MVRDTDTGVPLAAGWRLKLGGALFALSIVGPFLFLPLLTAMGLSTAMTATVSGVILAGAEVLGVAAVAVLGKSGYTYVKGRIFGFLRQYGPPRDVGRTRYNIGLVVFAVPILFGWLAPYAEEFIPGYRENVIAYAVAGDLLLLASLFVLGGDFWEKVRALFIYDIKAVSR